jgi:hypothetical protein
MAKNPWIFFPFRHGHATRAGVLIKQLRFRSLEGGRFPCMTIHNGAFQAPTTPYRKHGH